MLMIRWDALVQLLEHESSGVHRKEGGGLWRTRTKIHGSKCTRQKVERRLGGLSYARKKRDIKGRRLLSREGQGRTLRENTPDPSSTELREKDAEFGAETLISLISLRNRKTRGGELGMRGREGT